MPLSRYIQTETGHVLQRPTEYHNLLEGIPDEERSRVNRLIRMAFAHNWGDVYGQAPVIEGALEGAMLLHQRRRLAGYVTRRPWNTRQVSEEALERRGFPPLPVATAISALSKADLLPGLGCGAMVEDSPHEAADIASRGFRVFVVPPYNRTFAHPNARPVSSVLEAAEIFLGG